MDFYIERLHALLITRLLFQITTVICFYLFIYLSLLTMIRKQDQNAKKVERKPSFPYSWFRHIEEKVVQKPY